MITKEMAESLRVGQELWHNTMTNADGTPKRARVNGKCKTWKRRPGAFKLPMKHGMYEHFYIEAQTEDNTVGNARERSNWSLPERWAIERFWK